MKIEYKGIHIEIIQEDDQWCYSIKMGNHLYLGQFNSYEEALNSAKMDIDYSEGK